MAKRSENWGAVKGSKFVHHWNSAISTLMLADQGQQRGPGQDSLSTLLSWGILGSRAFAGCGSTFC